MIHPPFLELQYFVGAIPESFHVSKIEPLDTTSERIDLGDGRLEITREGNVFCGPFREERDALFRAGRDAYERFVSVADRIRCYYGAIQIDAPLETPDDLQRGKPCVAFENFYVDEELLGSEVVASIRQLAGADAYVEKRRTGIYVSTTAEFNPDERGTPMTFSWDLSARVAAVIAEAARRGRFKWPRLSAL